MSDPMREFARLFAAAKERWPAAPGLPEGYSFDVGIHSGRVRLVKKGEMGRCHYYEAAEALCVVSAVAFVAWWNDQEDERSAGVVRVFGTWHYDVYDDGDCLGEGDRDTIGQAYLAVMGVILDDGLEARPTEEKAPGSASRATPSRGTGGDQA